MKPFPFFSQWPSAVAVVLVVLMSQAATGQDTDTLQYTLPAVEIEATRATETEASAPFAVAIEARDPATIALDPGLSLDAVLSRLPGTWFNDRGHFALGERLSVRGMGWRSSFGVRGVQVVLDGIPLTMPDGQAILDIVDPSLIRRAEVLRGPASLFWGNGSGGALFLSTRTQADALTGRLRGLAGSDGLWQGTAELAAPMGSHQVHGFVSSTHQDGYRTYSQGRLSRAGLHGGLDLGPRSRLRLTAAASLLDTENPGSLTLEQLREDPRSADARNVATSAGKESFQGQVGATLDQATTLGTLTATAYGIVRTLENPLSFGVVDLDREAGGLRLALQDDYGVLSWGVGLDAGVQVDDRIEHDRTDAGLILEIDQQETVRNLAAYGVLTVNPLPPLQLSAGLRRDQIRFEMDDHKLDNGDQSGRRTFAAWSPSVGLSYQIGSAVLFTNFSTAFETPTTTELVNSPDGQGNFNPDIDPQRTRSIEAGARGAIGSLPLYVDVAAFHLIVSGLLSSDEGPTGETFFRNSGRTVHDGVEAALAWRLHPSLEAGLTYTGSRFVFDEGSNDGNRLPGIPEHRLYLSLQAEQGDLWGLLTLESASHFFADDANTAEADSYAVLDLNLGHTGLALGSIRLQPFLQIRNLTDTAYSGSVVVNAFGGRYYEPAPGRTVQAGLNVGF